MAHIHPDLVSAVHMLRGWGNLNIGLDLEEDDMNDDREPIICVNCGGVIPAGVGRATYVGRANGFKHRHSAECFDELTRHAEAAEAEAAALRAELDEHSDASSDALDLLWKEIILANDPNYGDWEYPGQAYRHLMIEFNNQRAELNALRARVAELEKQNATLRSVALDSAMSSPYLKTSASEDSAPDVTFTPFPMSPLYIAAKRARDGDEEE
jgi:hypothetical protein